MLLGGLYGGSFGKKSHCIEEDGSRSGKIRYVEEVEKIVTKMISREISVLVLIATFKCSTKYGYLHC